MVGGGCKATRFIFLVQVLGNLESGLGLGVDKTNNCYFSFTRAIRCFVYSPRDTLILSLLSHSPQTSFHPGAIYLLIWPPSNFLFVPHLILACGGQTPDQNYFIKPDVILKPDTFDTGLWRLDTRPKLFNQTIQWS